MSKLRESDYRVVVQSQLVCEANSFCQDLKPKTFTVSDSAWVLRTGNSLSTVQICPRSAEVLCGFEISQNKCKLVPTPAQPSLGFAVSRQVNPGSKRTCRLAPGNEVKLGQLSLIVREVNEVPSYSSDSDFFRADDIADFGVSTGYTQLTEPLQLSAASGQTCRICLWTEDPALGPLVSPCECVGTMGAVHVQCLRNWLHSKLVVEKNSRVATYSWQRFYCELCRTQYPDRLAVDGLVYDLIQIARPNGKFIVLEVKECIVSNRLVFVAALNEGRFLTMGRATHCDLSLPCLSVSKIHAYIRSYATGVFIEDRGSRAGTSIVLDKPVLLGLGKSLVLQAGPQLLTVSVKKRWSFTGFFCGVPTYDDRSRVNWVREESAGL